MIKAAWSHIPRQCGGGYGIPQDHEVHIDQSLQENPARARFVCLHEVAELWWRNMKHHSDIDLFCIDAIDALQQLGLL